MAADQATEYQSCIRGVYVCVMCICKCVYLYVHVYMYVFMCMCMYMYVCAICMCMCMCASVCMYVYVFMCKSILSSLVRSPSHWLSYFYLFSHSAGPPWLPDSAATVGVDSDDRKLHERRYDVKSMVLILSLPLSLSRSLSSSLSLVLSISCAEATLTVSKSSRFSILDYQLSIINYHFSLPHSLVSLFTFTSHFLLLTINMNSNWDASVDFLLYTCSFSRLSLFQATPAKGRPMVSISSCSLPSRTPKPPPGKAICCSTLPRQLAT